MLVHQVFTSFENVFLFYLCSRPFVFQLNLCHLVWQQCQTLGCCKRGGCMQGLDQWLPKCRPLGKEMAPCCYLCWLNGGLGIKSWSTSCMLPVLLDCSWKREEHGIGLFSQSKILWCWQRRKLDCVFLLCYLLGHLLWVELVFPLSSICLHFFILFLFFSSSWK